MRFLRVMTKIIIILLRIHKEAVKERVKKRDLQLAFYNRFLKIYSQVATSWIRKTIRKPLLTIYGDTDQKLSFDDDALQFFLRNVDKENERD
jgi:hypothetical protein